MFKEIHCVISAEFRNGGYPLAPAQTLHSSLINGASAAAFSLDAPESFLPMSAPLELVLTYNLGPNLFKYNIWELIIYQAIASLSN